MEIVIFAWGVEKRNAHVMLNNSHSKFMSDGKWIDNVVYDSQRQVDHGQHVIPVGMDRQWCLIHMVDDDELE